MKDAQEKPKRRWMNMTQKLAERQKTRDPIIQTEAQAAKTRKDYEDKIGLELEQQYKTIQSQAEKAKKTIELNVQDLVVLQQKGKAQQDLAQFYKDSANELKAQNDQQAATAEWVEQQHQRYLDLGRTKRMIYELELQAHKGMTDAGKNNSCRNLICLKRSRKLPMQNKKRRNRPRMISRQAQLLKQILPTQRRMSTISLKQHGACQHRNRRNKSCGRARLF